MPNLTLHHDRHFELVDDPDGDIIVQTASGPKRRSRVPVPSKNGRTTVRVPEGYDANPMALTHLVQALTERHAAEVDIDGVSGDDATLVAKVAALLDAQIINN